MCPIFRCNRDVIRIRTGNRVKKLSVSFTYSMLFLAVTASSVIVDAWDETVCTLVLKLSLQLAQSPHNDTNTKGSWYTLRMYCFTWFVYKLHITYISSSNGLVRFCNSKLETGTKTYSALHSFPCKNMHNFYGRSLLPAQNQVSKIRQPLHTLKFILRVTLHFSNLFLSEMLPQTYSLNSSDADGKSGLF